MKISCNMADDLLPLYLENSCSAESKSALEAHLSECPNCRLKLERMQDKSLIFQIKNERDAPPLVSYAKKVRNHRICLTVFITIMTIVAAFLLSIGYLTIRDMHRQENPFITEVEAGTYNLIANPLTDSAEEIGQYTFYTNTEQISVSIQGEETYQGTVYLWNAADNENYIMRSDLSDAKRSCVFTALSASSRYKISCDGLTGATITITENRTVSFWNSLKSVLQGL